MSISEKQVKRKYAVLTLHPVANNSVVMRLYS